MVACQEDTLDTLNTGTLQGTVVSRGANIPVQNVKITTNPASTTVFTDVDGRFVIDEITAGEYSVQADQQDYQTAFEAANVLEGATSNVVIELDSLEANNLPPLRPQLLSPTDEATGVERSPNLVWSSSSNDDDTITYTLELRRTDPAETQIYEQISDTTLTVESLKIGKTYFWQVTADDGINDPVVSEFASFTVQGVSDNRYLFVRNIDGNPVIFSGDEPIGQQEDQIDQNVIQLTEDDRSSFRPKINYTTGKIAFIGLEGGESHLFLMNPDGTDRTQLTRANQIAGFNLNEVEFTWDNDGDALYFPNFNRLIEVGVDGSGSRVVFEAPVGEFVSEIAVNPVSGLLAVKTNDASGYNVRIIIVNPGTGLVEEVIVQGAAGAFDGLDFSQDGNHLLYSRDVSGVENADYRRLDNRLFEYDFTTALSTEIDTGKPVGLNDLDPKYAPNDGYVIYTRTSNDGISERVIQRTQATQNASVLNELLFTDAFMPFWE